MTSPEQVDGRTFLENLQNITYRNTPPTTVATSAFLQFQDLVGRILQSFEPGFFAQFSATSPMTFKNVDEFKQAVFSYAIAHGIPNDGFGLPNIAGAGVFDQTFKDEYYFVVQPGGFHDFEVITPNVTVADINAQADKWFANFISTFNYSSGPLTASEFFVQMQNETSIVAGMNISSDLQEMYVTGTDPLFGNAVLISFRDIPNQAKIPRYEEIYKTYFPNATTAQFKAAISQFYHDQIAANGFFVPGAALQQWTSQVIQTSRGIGALQDNTTLASIGADKARILNNVYVLIASLLDTLQRIAAVQSNRLNILSQWQQAYSQSLSTIHSFLSTDTSPIGGDDISNTQKASIRGELNDSVNTNWRSLLQNSQSIIGDDSKSLQGNINQVQDSISQQNNRATAIIQELGTLLNAIFK